MMKFYNKIISLILSAAMILSCAGVPLSVFADGAQSGQEEDLPTGNYDEMIDYFRKQMKERKNKITFKFVTDDETYADKYEQKTTKDNSFGNQLNSMIYYDIFKSSKDPFLGDYLYNSIYKISNIDSDGKNISTGKWQFIIGFKFYYYTDKSQEDVIAETIKDFNSKYIDSSMTDYQKVKTIYDFVVRNCDYDENVYNDSNHTDYPIDSARFKNAHSAYGALFGNLIAENKSQSDFKNDYKTTISGEKIIKIPDAKTDKTQKCQGLAVCEGYSKLFYALCLSNNIECRIVGGDYSNKDINGKDPHEWNYVWLNDGEKDQSINDGYRWYQVDTTSASRASNKMIDFNNYDYFLKGRLKGSFSEQNHQIPYENYGLNDNDVLQQLYDWYADENKCCDDDYVFPKTKFSADENARKEGYIIKRSAVNYKNDKKIIQIEYIYTNLDGTFRVEVEKKFDSKELKTDDDLSKYIRIEDDPENFGFDYTGVDSTFEAVIPYVLNNEYEVSSASGKDVGEYTLVLTGDDSSVELPFKIVPRDMSNFEGNYDENKSKVQSDAPYTGDSLNETDLEIVDGFEHRLEKGRDFDAEYSDSMENIVPLDQIIDIGDYKCSLRFKGNYCGTYTFDFKIGKADLSTLNFSQRKVSYVPYLMCENKNNYLKNPCDSFKSFSVGKKKPLMFKEGIDYTVSSNSNSWDSGGGSVTITANPASKILKGETTFDFKAYKYNVNEYNGKVYDSGVYIYNGSDIYPSGKDGLTLLQEGIDYKIVSYSKNKNAGEAEVKIKGIGGCTGEAVLTYLISPKSIGSVKLENLKCDLNGKFSYTAKDGSRMLKKGVDYTEQVFKTSNGFKLKLVGKGNYTAAYEVNAVLRSSGSKKSSSGSSAKIVSTAKINVKKTSIKKLKAKKRAINVKWKKPGGSVSGYRIECSTSKSFNKNVKAVNVNKAKKTSCTVKKLKSKKKYYVRIRTFYRKGNVIYYSGWSRVKKVKVK